MDNKGPVIQLSRNELLTEIKFFQSADMPAMKSLQISGQVEKSEVFSSYSRPESFASSESVIKIDCNGRLPEPAEIKSNDSLPQSLDQPATK